MITHSIYLTKEKRWYAGFDLGKPAGTPVIDIIVRSDEPEKRLFLGYQDAVQLRRELIAYGAWQELGCIITLNMDGGEL